MLSAMQQDHHFYRDIHPYTIEVCTHKHNQGHWQSGRVAEWQLDQAGFAQQACHWVLDAPCLVICIAMLTTMLVQSSLIHHASKHSQTLNCMSQSSPVIVGVDLDGHMAVGGQLPPRQGQQQPGMLDHLSGIDFYQTLVSAQLSTRIAFATLSHACGQEHAGSSL